MTSTQTSKLVNWRATISYIGKDFFGWQIQPLTRTVAGELTKALSKVCGHSILINAAGRTDAGVHAHGQVVSFKMHSRINAFGLLSAMRSFLPKDVAMIKAEVMPDHFHARTHSIGKKYQYRILHSPSPDPFRGDYTWHRREPINLENMQKAAASLVGENNFQSFRAASCQAVHAYRYIWKISIYKEQDEFIFDIRGNAFCQNMIRIIVGTLYDIGRGLIETDEMANILAAKDRRKAGITAPAHGLSFFKVYYPDDMRDADIPKTAHFPRFPVTQESWPF